MVEDVRGGSLRVVIVGGGQAAGTAAGALREAGFPGPITIVGEELFPPYERPALSKDLLLNRCEASSTFLNPVQAYRDKGIELHSGVCIVEIDRDRQSVLSSDGVRFPYDALLLAMGARPRQLPVLAPSHRVLYLRTIRDATAISARLKPGAHVAIVGAGFIGLEVAAAARVRDCAVTVIEKAKLPLLRCVAPEIGRYFVGLHEAHGVRFRFGDSVVEQVETAAGLTLTTEQGEVLHVDVVIVGIGVQPNDALAKDAGLAVDDGIVVDTYTRTTDPKIYAAGDVTRHFNPLLARTVRLESWQNAQNQSRVAALNIAGQNIAYEDVPWFWTEQYGINFQTFGAPTDWDQVIWRGKQDDKQFAVFYLKRSQVIGAHTINSPREGRTIRQILQKSKVVDVSALGDVSRKLADQVFDKET